MKEVRGLINICRKAGYLVIGKDNIKDYTHKLFLCVVDKTAGNSLIREMKVISSDRKIPLVEIENLGDMLAIENCKAIAVKNKALSDEILKLIKGD